MFDIHGLQSGRVHSTGLANLLGSTMLILEEFPALFNIAASLRLNGLNALEGGEGGGVEAQPRQGDSPCKPYTDGLGE